MKAGTEKWLHEGLGLLGVVGFPIYFSRVWNGLGLGGSGLSRVSGASHIFEPGLEWPGARRVWG